MAQQPKEEKKMDFSSLPRGAISIKGLPVNRNTRLPSIRSPRDLTLGAAPKRTFMPNIPVRREKKSQMPENVSQAKLESLKIDRKDSPQLNDRGRGRGRGKPQIIQTQGSIFSDGIGVDPSLKKEKVREAYQRSEHSASSRGIFVKKEREENDIGSVSNKMDQLLRDDFIDDGDDDDECDSLFKPIIFPLPTEVKKESKTEAKEPSTDFNPNIAREMNFDINHVAKFIKKEKDSDIEEQKMPHVSAAISQNEIANLLNGGTNFSKLVLIQFPEFINLDQKMDDLESSHKKLANADSKISDNQNVGLASINSLPEGYIGKLQILKSGKTRLLIGPVELTLNSCNTLKTKHEVVSISTNSNMGDLTVLGYLQQVLKFVPNEDCLLT